MKMLLAVLATLCLVALHVCDASSCDKKREGPKCTKEVVTKATNYDFLKFAGYQYRIALLTDDPTVKDYESGFETTFQVNGDWYVILTVNKFDGSQENIYYAIDQWNGNEVIDTIVKNDAPVSTFRVVVYAFKELQYVQFLVCGDVGTTNDMRFTLIFGNVKMDKKLKQELIDNDKKQNFNSNLVEIGKQQHRKTNAEEESADE